MVKTLVTFSLLWMLLPSSAFAGESASSEGLPVFRTARTLAQNEWRIGLLQSSYGITDNLDVGIYHLYFVAPLWNVNTKLQVWRGESGAAVALTGGVYLADTSSFYWYDDTTSGAWFVAFPTELLVTLPVFSTLILTPSLGLNLAIGEGDVDSGQTQGVVAANQATFGLHTEWLLSDVFLVGLRLKYSPFSALVGSGEAEVTLDSRTSARVQAAGSIDPNAVQNAFSTTLYLLMSWDVFHLRVGGGWGSLTVPGLNVMIANRTPLADFDLFWRF